MWKASSGIIGTGYEGKDVLAFVEEMRVWEIGTVVDVRLNPVSRKKGFSKRALSEALAAANIAYLHLPALGNPKDNREGFGQPGTHSAQVAGARFISLLEEEEAAAAVRLLADLSTRQRVAVMCFEASERCCHRQYVIAQVKELLEELMPA
jgi:uncharacterized protein (DUF488 family)